MLGMAGVSLRPPNRRPLGEERLAVRAVSTVREPRSDPIRKVTRVALMVEGELFERLVPAPKFLDFVLKGPFPSADATTYARIRPLALAIDP